MAGPSLLIKKRLIILLVSFSILITALIVRLAWIQIFKGDWYQKEAYQQQTRGRDISPKRGKIYDRNGKELAISASVEKVIINPQQVRDSDMSDEAIAGDMAVMLDMDSETILKKVKKRSSYEVIKRKISKDTGDKIREWCKKNDIAGVYIDEDTKRFYPNRNLAAHVLGFTGDDNQGLDGIEAIMDAYLKGIPGKILSETDARGRELPIKEEKHIGVQDGANVVLTIDETIQYFAQKALEKAIDDNKLMNGASAIVMDPRNGDILALVSKPDFDLNDPWGAPPGEDPNTWNGRTKEGIQKLQKTVWRNKAVVDTYEPGSTFKAITSAAGLEEGAVTPDTQTSDFPISVQGHTIYCWRRGREHGNETFRQGVYFSCNPVFVKVSQSLGPKKFFDYVRAFGFYDRTEISLPGEAKSIMFKNPKEIDMAVSSFGQRFQITPLQLISSYTAIANGGKLMKPRIVKEITDSEGNIIERFEPEVVRNVISKKTSDTLREILEGVVSEGTGKNAYISGYHVAGKTGTSETTIKDRYIASFSSFAPADNPVICVLVVLDYPKGPFGHQGGVIAAPVAKSILEDTLEYLGVEKRYTEKDKEMMTEQVFVPDIRGKSIAEARKVLSAAQFDLKFKVEGEGYNNDTVVVDQTPKPGISLNKKSVVILYTYKPKQQKMIKIPDVRNKTIDEATQTLNKLGLNIKVNGDGVAFGQEYEPGAEVEKGDVINVDFRHPDTE
ncbi:MAG: penicillin-binding transpeptidase domain-containing protein [Clostridia bacterium]|nr:penicillin-binding transpeptidase domain-containing protein [Clostridia bacterium]